MKVICFADNNLAVHAFPDDIDIFVSPMGIQVGNPARLIIADMGSDNAKFYERVELPQDYIGAKYFYDGASWNLNPDWTEVE